MADSSLLVALTATGGAAALAWLAVLLDPARAWDLRPTAEDEPPPRDLAEWPPVGVVVPARNEAASLPGTLPALLAQDYPGPWTVVVVDDRSDDGTAAAARSLAQDDGRLTVLDGDPLPAGWLGKVWALQQGCDLLARAGEADYVLLTDADIHHRPGSLRRLVAESEAGNLALNSRMARLRTQATPERLLIPAFVFFFNLLYPMRRVNDPGSGVAAAAGGCVLVRSEALRRAGGPEAIRGQIIDDVNLARRVKALGEPIRLATSRADVVSLREYGSLAAVWRMVRRTAFDELRYSWFRLAVAVLGLLLLFAIPPALAVVGIVLGLTGAASPAWSVALGLTGAVAWCLMSIAYARAIRLFELPLPWALTLPLAGVLYGGMTIDSARRHVQGSRGVW